MDDFEKYWREEYPLCPPLGHLLRVAYEDRWFRIHTLPDSKRYPENKSEVQEILKLHNDLLSDLIGNEKPYILLLTRRSGGPRFQIDEDLPKRISGALPKDMRETFFFLDEEEPDNSFYWNFFIKEKIWKHGCEDQLLKEIMLYKEGNVLFINKADEIIYHPYDGGANIFIKSSSLKDGMKKKYERWFVPHL